MPVIKYFVTLPQEERQKLEAIKSRGKHTARKTINTLVLLKCDKGEFQVKHSDPEIEEMLEVSNPRIWRVKKAFIEEELEISLTCKKGTRAYRHRLDGDGEANLIALSCSNPPEG